MVLPSRSRVRLTGLFILLGCWLQVSAAHAQEFDCRVTIDYSQLSGSDYSFLDQLDDRVEEYINESRWTNDQYAALERIHCDFRFYFQEAISLTEFRIRLVVASRRPIYGTAQSTPVVQFTDSDVQFTYTQGQPLMADVETYDPLTTVLDYYLYVLLGYDYDTFEEMGGTEYFEQARRIVDLARTNGATGWSQIGGTDREGLVQQMLDPRFRPLRLAYHTYHFEGLDRFVSDTREARQSVMDVLEALNALYDDVSRQYALDLFFATKYDELAAIFEGSPMSSQAYATLTRLDPAHGYERLVE